MKSFQTFKKKVLKDTVVRSEYKKLDVEFKLIALLIEKRTKKGITQTALAKKTEVETATY